MVSPVSADIGHFEQAIPLLPMLVLAPLNCVACDIVLLLKSISLLILLLVVHIAVLQ